MTEKTKIPAKDKWTGKENMLVSSLSTEDFSELHDFAFDWCVKFESSMTIGEILAAIAASMSKFYEYYEKRDKSHNCSDYSEDLTFIKAKFQSDNYIIVTVTGTCNDCGAVSEERRILYKKAGLIDDSGVVVD